MSNPNEYTAANFRVLKDLEPVRERPGMYTRTVDPGHMIQEVIDNAADEALGGYAKNVDVVLNDDGSLTISDDGRGIPFDLHPEEQVPAVTLAFTRLHAGGKFDKKKASGAYKFSGGLHGVGVAVTTALSKKVVVESRRGGRVQRVEYLDGGRQIGQPQLVGTVDKSVTGTTVQVWIDPRYFEAPKVPMGDLQRLLQSKAVLLKGVTVSLTVNGEKKVWTYSGGLAQYLQELAGDAEAIVPAYVAEKYHSESEETAGDSTFAPGEGAEFAICWYPEGAPTSQSFVNLIPTREGGTHVSGLKVGVFEAMKSFIEHRALLPRGVKLHQDDVCGRMGYVLSAKVLDPEFQGQVKDKLNTRSAHKLVATAVRDPFEVWLTNNVEAGTAIAQIAIHHALARQKSGKVVEKRRSSSVVVLPGKLTDCRDREDNELFLVEGDSAGGSAKAARNKENQAVLPLRGKVMNTLEVERYRLFANTEIHDMSVAFGIEPHSLTDDASKVLAGLRYDRIMIMTDADVDGAHIRTLLLTLFYTHFPLLVVHGHIWIVESPLFRIDVPSVGKNKPARRLYPLNEAERERIYEALAREKIPESRITSQRFKGLGEMNSPQLKETSMDPGSRSAFPVRFDPNLAERVHSAFELVAAGNHAGSRREWMSRKGSVVELDV